MQKKECREMFEARGLTYTDVTAGDIGVLAMLLNKHVKAASKAGKMSTGTMHMSDKIQAKYKSNGTLLEGYLFMNSHYFTRRECVSFNRDGFIGFMGWADDANSAPVIAAFTEWVDTLGQKVQEAPELCEWTGNDEHDGCIVWVSSCGNVHILGAGGPEENEMKYCCYCGKPLVENDALKSQEG